MANANATSSSYMTLSRQGPITRYESAKEYLDKHNVPKMFECLISTLMMEKPENHVKFLDTKLDEIKEQGQDNVNWETFIQHMHPLRDPLRQELIKSDDEKSKDQDQFADQATIHRGPNEQKNNADTVAKTEQLHYKPEVFSLTEPAEEDYY